MVLSGLSCIVKGTWYCHSCWVLSMLLRIVTVTRHCQSYLALSWLPSIVRVTKYCQCYLVLSVLLGIVKVIWYCQCDLVLSKYHGIVSSTWHFQACPALSGNSTITSAFQASCLANCFISIYVHTPPALLKALQPLQYVPHIIYHIHMHMGDINGKLAVFPTAT
jgi:hypothetical protein